MKVQEYTCNNHNSFRANIIFINNMCNTKPAVFLPFLKNTESNTFCIVGDADPVVPCEFGEMSKGVLTSFCSKVEFKKYSGMAHSSSDQVSLLSPFFVNSQST